MRLVLLALTACAPGTVTLEDPAVDCGTPVETTADPVELPEPTEPTGPIAEPTAPAEDYRLGGPYTVEVRNEEAAVASCEGGEMAYTVYRPNGIEPLALAVLAHGWVREKAFMAGWADHWASWGITVVTPDLCHTELWDTDHELNAQELLDLQAVIAQGTPVLWAGHSAGGLATLLASVGDPTALGHLGLDLVDSDALGASVAPNVTVPAALLSGEPDLCNEEGNALPVYSAIPDTDGLRVVGAGHCDFESPTDWGCTTFCDGGTGEAAVPDVIRGLSTAWVLWRSGLAPEAAEWWTPGTRWYDELATAGAIARP